ncbi:MAG: alkanal monooxygenase [Thermoleophilia bacterium]|nr:alkanal monooxygenase [Thermoleophilia bacterium]
MSELAPLHVPISILDVAPVVSGSTPTDALRAALELAQLADRSGYTRVWYAEHHNMPGIASSAPEILIATVLAQTERLRVGSGGVMLPNHAPLMVAERFGTLEALYPGRVDLGIGRAPGSDPRTSQALRRHLGNPDLPELLEELFGFFDDAGTNPLTIQATPGRGYRPDVWLLGSSGSSAQLAALLGLPFATAHHFSPGATVGSLHAYRELFWPTTTPGIHFDGSARAALPEPHGMITVQTIVADTEEQARRIGDAFALMFLRIRQGRRPDRMFTQEQVDAYDWSPEERAWADGTLAQQAVGTPEMVHARLTELLAETGATELMATAMAPSQADRLRSFELLAELAGIGVPA